MSTPPVAVYSGPQLPFPTDEPDSEPELNDQGENVIALLIFQEDWADTLLEIVVANPILDSTKALIAKNEAGKTWNILPTGELVGQDCEDIPAPSDFPIRIIKDALLPVPTTTPEGQPGDEVQQDLNYVKPVPNPYHPVTDPSTPTRGFNNNDPGQVDELLSATTPPQAFGPTVRVRTKPASKTQAAPPKASTTSTSTSTPTQQYATPIVKGNINFYVYPHAGTCSPEDWKARANMVKAIDECPTISVRTYYPNEMIIRAIGSPDVDLPQPFLPEGPKSAAVAVTLMLPYSLIVATRGRLRVHMGLEVACTTGCSLQIVPWHIDPHDSSSWEDMYVPGLKPVQTSLDMSSNQPFTPVILDLHNSWVSDVQQNGHTPIAVMIMRPGPLVRKVSSNRATTSSGAASSSRAPA
jgi:hypothetical protein